MSTVFVNKDRIPSSSHNATGEDENGMFWPANTRFQTISKERERFNRKRASEYRSDYKHLVFVEQVGGEEVLVMMNEQFFKDHFVREDVA